VALEPGISGKRIVCFLHSDIPIVWGFGFGQLGTAPETLLKVLNCPLPELENLEFILSTEM
jgi:hypothetical protein